MYTWANQCCTDIVSASERCGSIGAVHRININGIRNCECFCQFNQTTCHNIIVRAGRVFCTDGYIGFFTAEIITHGAHIDGNHFIDFTRNPSCTMSHFLVVRDEERKVVERFPAFTFNTFQQSEKGSHACFVI
ncbi:hypothetical protein D3C76_937170 [compost metagenome]